MYVDAIVAEIYKHGVLGKCVTKISVIECQKRGLPHCHLLIHLANKDKLHTTSDIDSLLCAELPEPVTQPLLYETVKSTMMHGPCGNINPDCPCMINLKCSKHFPKEFSNTTTLGQNASYPDYRRRDDNRVVEKRGKYGKTFLDNRSVVPYNPYLSQKYNCHINVESCHNVKAVKYLYKYIYKGHDESSVPINQNQSTPEHNEINEYVEGRYVSAPEAAWRIFAFPLHNNSHQIVRWACHLPQKQNVIFKPGEEDIALCNVKHTTLTAWFELNKCHDFANTLLYVEIVHHYIFVKGEWRKRKRNPKGPILGRMYNVSPRDVERYHLRLLLLHVHGATSFSNLKTVKGIIQASFKEACLALCLISDDNLFVHTLQEAILYASPYHCRRTFSYILLFCEVSDPLTIWQRFQEDLYRDFIRRGFSKDSSENAALLHIQSVLKFHGSDIGVYCLPKIINPTVFLPESVDQMEARQKFETMEVSLNSAQLNVVHTVIKSIQMSLSEVGARIFFLDGLASCGKTYVYNCILAFCKSRNISVVSSAWCGIAATLLQDGQT